MKRWMTGFLLATGGLIATPPEPAAAQAAIQVQLYWQWGDDGWRPYRSAYAPPRAVYHAPPGRVVRVPPREVVYYTPQRAVRVPPGHLPPPGYCRLWYPGRPPGHQPPPRPCGQLFRGHGYAGAVIVGAPTYHEVYGTHPGAYRDDRGHRGKKPKKRGRGW
jgi:hypothetical protein